MKHRNIIEITVFGILFHRSIRGLVVYSGPFSDAHVRGTLGRDVNDESLVLGAFLHRYRITDQGHRLGINRHDGSRSEIAWRGASKLAGRRKSLNLEF